MKSYNQVGSDITINYYSPGDILDVRLKSKFYFWRIISFQSYIQVELSVGAYGGQKTMSISWSQRYMWLAASWYECRQPNPGPLQDHYPLWTPVPPLQSPRYTLFTSFWNGLTMYRHVLTMIRIYRFIQENSSFANDFQACKIVVF